MVELSLGGEEQTHWANGNKLENSETLVHSGSMYE